MLLNSVIIILREVLEAAMLASILLAISVYLRLSVSWFLVAISAGFVGAMIYAYNFSSVSEWFEYTGQEIFNASLQALVFCCLLLIVFLISLPGEYHKKYGQAVTGPMVLAIACAVTREGAEIMLYLSGFLGSSEHIVSVLTGAMIGACLGASAGALMYYGLVYSYGRYGKMYLASQMVLAVVAAGILGQTVPLLMQADILPAQRPLWDSTALLPEDSIAGQLLYAIGGYEGTPVPLHVAVYFGGVSLFALLIFISARSAKNSG